MESEAVRIIRTLPLSQGAKNTRRLIWDALDRLEAEYAQLPQATVTEIVATIREQLRDSCVRFSKDDWDEIKSRVATLDRRMLDSFGVRLSTAAFNGA